MLKTTKRYVITTNAMNAYKFRLLSLGLDWKQYDNNPIMLYMHFRASGRSRDEVQPLGSVREIEYNEQTGEYTGRLYFNPKDAFAVSVYEMYENGTMNMLSIGVEVVELSEDPELMEAGQLYATVTKAIVKEISCVDIGANAEACAVALYDATGKTIMLSDKTSLQPFFSNQQINSNMKLVTLSAPAILTLLKLSDAATEAEAVAAIQNLVTLSDTQKTQIETLTGEKKKAEEDLDALKTLSDTQKIETLVNSGVGSKYTKDMVPHLTKLAEGNFENAKQLIEKMPVYASLADSINNGEAEKDPELEAMCKKTFLQLFHSGELETVKLKAPEDFKRIYKAHYGKEPK